MRCKKYRSYSSASCCNAEGKQNVLANASQGVDDMTLFACLRKNSSEGADNRHHELVGWLRPITMMYLWPPFTASIPMPTLIQPNWPSVCLECHLPSLSCCLTCFICSLPLSLYLFLSTYLSLYLSVAATIEFPPPPSPHPQPPPLLSPPLCSK